MARRWTIGDYMRTYDVDIEDALRIMKVDERMHGIKTVLSQPGGTLAPKQKRKRGIIDRLVTWWGW